eukprot:CAMPEP_0201566242 /NCGR_PEP_ID=MMETSP0190_2-20130828/5904_1 /ASSEMBLY_ACC=CAM_ASM_000263 /TAXON_ID=37353 /ORGANISM="Rosalina sp." /LENGTH=82 /DNA_ID=CAMNT_0047984707 /DNA_START=72 /DNA_END=318 /DNA_ORIENTATION=+
MADDDFPEDKRAEIFEKVKVTKVNIGMTNMNHAKQHIKQQQMKMQHVSVGTSIYGLALEKSRLNLSCKLLKDMNIIGNERDW